MKILFSALHFGYFRNFESVIGELAARGHRIHLLAEESERFGGQSLVERLAATHPTVSWGFGPDRGSDRWLPVARKVRHGLEYVRFLDSRYADRQKVRQVAEERAPRLLIALLRRLPFNSATGRRVMAAMLRRAEWSFPLSVPAVSALRELNPDLLLLASLTYSRSQQIDYLKAARALGIRAAACVMGFDHLSSKAPIHIVPDRLFVWNETQRREAVELHGISPDRIVVTGAQCYDVWFDRQPSRPRAAFCRLVGLDPDRPFVLYLCSAMSPNPHEARFVLEWVKGIRTCDHPLLRNAGVLIRPHPERLKDWSGVDLRPFQNVSLHGRNPVDTAAQADYFDALSYASAAVGLVTSAFLEAGIAGRPVYTLLLPEFRLHQEGMRHFKYLVEIEGGLLCPARSFREHFLQLAAAVEGRVDRRAQTHKFLEAFVRPRGLDVRATEVFGDEIETMGRTQAPDCTDAAWISRLLQPVMARLAIGASGASWLMDPVEYRDAVATAQNLGRKHAQRAGKAHDKRRRVARKRWQRLVVGLKTAAKRAVGRPIESSQASGGEGTGQ